MQIIATGLFSLAAALVVLGNLAIYRHATTKTTKLISLLVGLGLIAAIAVVANRYDF